MSNLLADIRFEFQRHKELADKAKKATEGDKPA